MALCAPSPRQATQTQATKQQGCSCTMTPARTNAGSPGTVFILFIKILISLWQSHSYWSWGLRENTLSSDGKQYQKSRESVFGTYCGVTEERPWPGTGKAGTSGGTLAGRSRLSFFLFHLEDQGRARTQSPTTRNYAVEIPTFGEFAGVSTAGVQWLSLALGEPPS